MDALEMVYRLLSTKSALYLTWLFKSLSLVQLFVTPWIVARQAPLSLEFSRQAYWSGLPFPPPGDFPNPGIKPRSPVSLVLAGGLFTWEALPSTKPCVKKAVVTWSFQLGLGPHPQTALPVQKYSSCCVLITSFSTTHSIQD